MDILELSKELGLTSQKAKEIKPLFYLGVLTHKELTPCQLVEVVSEQPKVVKILVNGVEHNIALDYLKEMQPKKEVILKFFPDYK